MGTFRAAAELAGLSLVAFLVMFGVPFAVWLFLGAGQ